MISPPHLWLYLRAGCWWRSQPLLWQHWGHDWFPALALDQDMLAGHHPGPVLGEYVQVPQHNTLFWVPAFSDLFSRCCVVLSNHYGEAQAYPSLRWQLVPFVKLYLLPGKLIKPEEPFVYCAGKRKCTLKVWRGLVKFWIKSWWVLPYSEILTSACVPVTSNDSEMCFYGHLLSILLNIFENFCDNCVLKSGNPKSDKFLPVLSMSSFAPQVSTCFLRQILLLCLILRAAFFDLSGNIDKTYTHSLQNISGPLSLDSTRTWILGESSKQAWSSPNNLRALWLETP